MNVYRVIPASTFSPIKWVGGTTTELFIFPNGSNYHQRDFDFRLSTATVEVATSEFTKLPGVSRTLMVLDGAITLSHEDQHVTLLKKFDIDQFKGDWKTSCKGTCTDFNLMTRGETSGDVRAIVLERDQKDQLVIKENTNWSFLYVYSGNVVITINGTPILLSVGDVLVLEKCQRNVLAIKGIEKSELVFVQIRC